MSDVGPAFYGFDADSAAVGSRKAEILDTSAALFAASGVAGTSVREIAAACGIKSGALYNYFGSKEEMVATIIAAFLGELCHDTEAAANGPGDFRDRFRALSNVAIDAIVRRRDACLLYQNEVMYLRGDAAYGGLAEQAARIRGAWLDVLRGGAAAGVFRSDLEPDLMYRLVRDGLWSAVRWYRPGGALSPADLAASYASILLSGIDAP